MARRVIKAGDENEAGNSDYNLKKETLKWEKQWVLIWERPTAKWR
jgi:hypothetical protein